MRNAPPHPDSWATPLVGGQRISRRLPWYMGKRGAPMEPELLGLEALLEREAFAASASICLDAHSGFGMVDRLWFPYARTRRPPPHLAEIHAVAELLDETLPNHVYSFEPQAGFYTIEGDFWDYAYDRFRAANPGGTMVQLTLEMGSWSWVRKNPRQLLSRFGSFDPMVPHRRRPTLRRHLALLDLLWRAVLSPDAWSVMSARRASARRSPAGTRGSERASARARRALRCPSTCGPTGRRGAANRPARPGRARPDRGRESQRLRRSHHRNRGWRATARRLQSR